MLRNIRVEPVSFSVKIAVFQESSSCTKLVNHHICLAKTEDLWAVNRTDLANVDMLFEVSDSNSLSLLRWQL